MKLLTTYQKKKTIDIVSSVEGSIIEIPSYSVYRYTLSDTNDPAVATYGKNYTSQSIEQVQFYRIYTMGAPIWVGKKYRLITSFELNDQTNFLGVDYKVYYDMYRDTSKFVDGINITYNIVQSKPAIIEFETDSGLGVTDADGEDELDLYFIIYEMFM